MTIICWHWGTAPCWTTAPPRRPALPRQCNAIRACLAKLAEYEAAGSTDLDAVSGCFGALMAELFDYRQDRWAPELRSIGFHLASSSTCWNAYDDLPRDKRRGAYNPLRELSTHPDYEEEMLDIFELLLARCAQNLSVCPAWRTRTCCATSCIPAYG